MNTLQTPRRRRLQIRLRTLGIVVLLIAIAAASYRQYLTWRNMIGVLESAEHLAPSDLYDGWPSVIDGRAVQLESASFRGNYDFGDSDLLPLLRLRQLKSLSLQGTEITDRSAVHLNKFYELKVLSLSRTEVTDQLLRSINRLDKINRLELSGTPVSDQGMRCVSKLSQLRYLDISETKVSDVGLQAISNLHQLQVLKAHHLPLTPKGLSHLGVLDLQELAISRCSAEHLEQIARIQTLRSLVFSDAYLAGDAEQLLAMRPLKHLVSLSIRLRKGPTDGRIWSQIGQIKTLHVRASEDFSMSDHAAIRSLTVDLSAAKQDIVIENVPSLQVLRVRVGRHAGHRKDVYLQITNAPSLRSLVVDWCNVRLDNTPKLTRLEACGWEEPSNRPMRIEVAGAIDDLVDQKLEHVQIVE